MSGQRRHAGPAAAAAAALLCLGLVAAGWADVALTLPADLLRPGTYQPVQWTAEQVESMRRRALLQQAAGGGLAAGGGDSGSGGRGLALPVCELGLSYRIVELEGANFTSVVTLQNNREVSWWSSMQQCGRHQARCACGACSCAAPRHLPPRPASVRVPTCATPLPPSEPRSWTCPTGRSCGAFQTIALWACCGPTARSHSRWAPPAARPCGS